MTIMWVGNQKVTIKCKFTAIKQYNNMVCSILSSETSLLAEIVKAIGYYVKVYKTFMIIGDFNTEICEPNF